MQFTAGDPPMGTDRFERTHCKGGQGCGEGNFKALFESIELDPMRCGVLEQT